MMASGTTVQPATGLADLLEREHLLNPEQVMRYKAIGVSQSGHCCFEATVVDTTRPVMIGGEHYKEQFEAVCECFSAGEANMIADALNRTASQSTGDT